MLNRLGRLETYVHTYQEKVIEISPEMIVPRNYNRFVGLAEQLLLVGKVPPDAEKPLARVLDRKLEELVREKRITQVYRLDEKGALIKPRELAKIMVQERGPAMIVGVFQGGDFSEEVKSIDAESYSIFYEALPVWSILSHMLALIADEAGVP
jgi:rRNA small subunit pseudouridine methyltransferase Nep1